MSSEFGSEVVDFFAANGLVFELLISVALFTVGLARQPRFAARVALSAVGLIAVSWLWSVLVPGGIWTRSIGFAVLIALAGVAIACCWRVTAAQAMFYVVVAAVMQHFAFRGARTVTAIVQGFVPATAWVDLVIYPLALVPFFALGFVLFARPLVGKNTGALDRGPVLMLVAGMLLCVNVFTNLFDELNPDGLFSIHAVFYLLDLVTCVFLLALTVEIVKRESAEENSEVLAQLLHQQKQQMESSRETIELINVKTHDLKQQIALLGDRIPQDEVDELRQLVGIYDSVVRTGNEALDVLLAQKSLICERRGIPFDRIVDGKRLAFMKSGDIYALFGNAIDNAIEAVSRIPQPERRRIGLKVARSKGMLAIRIENPYDGGLVFDDGLPRTTKDDPRYHGFGMRSIRMIVERYEGFLSVSARDGAFALTILLPMTRP